MIEQEIGNHETDGLAEGIRVSVQVPVGLPLFCWGGGICAVA